MTRVPNIRWRLLAVVTVSAIALSGCTESKPTPTETTIEVPKTIDQYVAELAQYTDPAELQLPAGADADTFGRWVVDLNNKWGFASCDRVRDIIRASVNLRVGDGRVEFYPKIAEANADALTIAMFGTNWQANPAAVEWRDASIRANAVGIEFCAQGLEDEAITEEFVSARQTGQDSEGNPIFDVSVNVVSASPDASNLGPRTYTYDTGVDDGHLIVDSIS